jgi:hypothetical protein
LVKRSAIISLIALSRSAIIDFRDGWGEREIKTTKSNMAAKFKKVFITMWTNLTKFWHKNEFKNIVWQKEPVENT